MAENSLVLKKKARPSSRLINSSPGRRTHAILQSVRACVGMCVWRARVCECVSRCCVCESEYVCVRCLCVCVCVRECIYAHVHAQEYA